jgi:hypothetical protein
VIDLFLADGEQMRPFLADVPIITDDRPWTQFPLGRVLFRGDAYADAIEPAQLRACIAGNKLSRLVDSARR